MFINSCFLNFLIFTNEELGIRGYRLRSLSSGAFAGLKNKNLLIKLMNTSLTSLQPALFFPVPRSAIVNLDITGNQK